MGAVYLAEDQRLVGRRCAIKENRTDLTNASTQALAQAREQFLAEASVLARLDHASLPKVSDYFIENNREYLVMDYVDGEDLESRLQRTTTPLPEEVVVSVADQVLDALAYLHSQTPQPIIHRDIKPANLRLNVHGRVKLVDFGLVKLLDANNPETKIELRGLGTPAYAPLEQFAGSDDHTDVRSDVYSLGATMYHLLTHLYPPDVHQRLLHPETLLQPRELNNQLSEHTQRVVMKAMEIYPADRYQTANEMRQALREADSSAKIAAAPPVRAQRGSVLTTLFATIGLVVVLGLLGVFGFALFNRERGNASPISANGNTDSPTATPTELVLQSLSDAPTGTPTETALAEAATPVVEETPTPEATPTETSSPTPTPETPTPTATDSDEPETSPVGTIPEDALVGTIAYPVFNGTTYDLYFGQVDGSGTRLFRQQASQPAFNPDGSRIAFHSWNLGSWGLINSDISAANEILITTFVEDQLPTWSADGGEIIYLSRREGDRKSRLIRVGSFQQRANGAVIGEGEYPTIGPDNRLIFKGWGNSGTGIRATSLQFDNLQVLTQLEVDTAPAPSPDGERIAFMSQRDGNWEIYMVNSDGSNLQRLTDDPGQDGLPAWSPDGEAIAFVSSRGGAWGVWAMTPEGEDQQQLFPMEGSPDGFVGSTIATASTRGWAEERISWKR
jgi:serine/threonine-protein kinase